ncbi:MAG TPA: ATP-dependent Zn protease [Leptolyngbyaceae cyanobacterium M65_K2018_010]|nr:ATP-dependent Zn protease [Leptolyngbyaceae cyanobacterium M65_K2018_010]
MRDTTLNTIAIVVFLTTMASLLGPLVNLSPAWVAGCAATGLGLFTLDQLNLQGRLGHILTDALAWLSPEHRQRVLHHEAGHFLAAVLLEIPVEAYTLTTWEAWKRGLPGQGGVVFGHPEAQTLPVPCWTPQTLDRYAQVWMAGIAAEHLIYGNAWGGDRDTQTVSQLWQGLGLSPQQASMKQRWAALQAKTLLENHRAAYDALVTTMEQRASVAVCRQVIQQHSPEPLALGQ